MAVERWDSVKWGSWRTDKFKISRKKYRWKTEQIIRFSFHHYLFPPLKNIHFVQMVPIANGKHVMLQVSQYKSVVVKPTKTYLISSSPTAQVLFVFWDNYAGRNAGKASRQTAIFRIQKITFPSTRNVFLLTILDELRGFYMCMFLNLGFQAGITRGNTDWRYIWKMCTHETLAVMNYWRWQ